MSPSKRAEMTALAPARRRIYRFLSAAFSEPPSPESLSAIRHEEFVTPAETLFGPRALATIRDCAEFAREPSDAQAQAQREFMNLLKVPGPQYVSPYESVYRDSREVGKRRIGGLLMGPSAVDVQKWYALAALQISPEYKDLPDHIGLELNYLAHLCAKEQGFAAASEQSKLIRAWQMQRDFLAAHIVSWVKALCDNVKQKSEHPYFRAVAEITAEFTVRDLATLEDLLGPSSGHTRPQYDSPDA